jgi:hypothetical protein
MRMARCTEAGMTRRLLGAGVIYLLFFAVALRLFLTGRHVAALVLVLVVWAALSLWLRFGGMR